MFYTAFVTDRNIKIYMGVSKLTTNLSDFRPDMLTNPIQIAQSVMWA